MIGHPGVTRSVEPGIQKRCRSIVFAPSCLIFYLHRLWIPGSILRIAPG